MPGYNFHPKARLEFKTETEQYAQIDPDLAADFDDRLTRAIDLICENPECVRRRKNHRRFNLTRFPFYLPDIIRENNVIILAVAHNSPKPGYWKDRFSDQ